MGKTIVGELEALLGLNAQEFVDNLRKSQQKLATFTAKANKSMDTVQKGFRFTANAVKGLGFAIAALSFKQLIELSDQFKLLNARIANASKSQKDFIASQQRLIEIAKNTGTSLNANVDVYQRLAKTADTLGASNEQILQFIENSQKLGIIGGTGAEAVDRAMFQMGQALDDAKFRMQEFNSISDQAPEIFKEVAKGMGISTVQLTRMARKGELLVEDVFAAMLKQTEDINEQFDKMPTTLQRFFNLASIHLMKTADLIFLNTVEAGKLEVKVSDVNNLFEKTSDIIGKTVRFLWDLGKTTLIFFGGLANEVGMLFLRATRLATEQIKTLGQVTNNFLKMQFPDKILGFDNPFKPRIDTSGLDGFFGFLDEREKKGAQRGRDFADQFGSALADTINPGRALVRRADVTRVTPRSSVASRAGALSDDKKAKKKKQKLVSVTTDLQRLTDVVSVFNAEVERSANSLFEGAIKPFDQWTDLTNEAIQLTTQLRTPLEVYNDEVARLNAMMTAPGGALLSQETFNRAMEQTKKNLMQADDGFKAFQQTMGRWTNTFVDSLARGQFQFKNFAASILADISRMIFQLTVLEPLMAGITGGRTAVKTGSPAKKTGNFVTDVIGNSIGSFFGGFFADGGRPPMGKVSVVGEKGPELFVPDQRGTVVPNAALGGGAPIVQQTVIINTIDGDNFRAKMLQNEDIIRGIAIFGVQRQYNQRAMAGPLG